MSGADGGYGTLSGLVLHDVVSKDGVSAGCEVELHFRGPLGETFVCYCPRASRQHVTADEVGKPFDVNAKLGARCQHRGMVVRWLKAPRWVRPTITEFRQPAQGALSLQPVPKGWTHHPHLDLVESDDGVRIYLLAGGELLVQLPEGKREFNVSARWLVELAEAAARRQAVR